MSDFIINFNCCYFGLKQKIVIINFNLNFAHFHLITDLKVVKIQG